MTYPRPQWRSRRPSRESRKQQATRLKFGNRVFVSPPLPRRTLPGGMLIVLRKLTKTNRRQKAPG
eukprot:1220585-Pyramimonas_sp.AAC.1